MQTIFIEENLNHQQILNLCKLIDSGTCKSLEFRRCSISNSDFDELMNSLLDNSKSIVSLIFNIQMINEQNRFKKFIQMLANCSHLINLRVHGNNINDDMFSELCIVLNGKCPKLSLLDIGDNRLTNQSIVNLCSLIIPNDKRTGLEELILSANQWITNAGWTELLFSISFNSRIRRLALDYNVLDNTTVAMLSMIIAASRTLTHLDLECCDLTEYAGQLFLSLFTKYPVKLEELYLDKNPSILDSTHTLIRECLKLKSRQNSISDEQLLSRNEHSTSIHRNINENVQSVILKKKKKKSILKEPSKLVVMDETKSFGFNPIKTIETKKKEHDDDDGEEIEELLPVATEPFGIIGPQLYWHRI